jgi:hypothetical protein
LISGAHHSGGQPVPHYTDPARMVQALTESVIECSRLAEEQEPYQQDRDHPANPIHATASLHAWSNPDYFAVTVYGRAPALPARVGR